jgi:hypothetical protein
MATPQRQYPPPEPPRRPELRNLSEGGVEKKVAPGWRFGFWWLWILIIVGIWYVGFGWGNSGGWVWGHRNAVQNGNDAAMTGDGAVILNATNKRGYIGQAFQVRNAPIERTASSVALWIGSATNSTPMLLVTTGIPSNPGNAGLEGGQWIYASGRVMAAPNAAQAKQQWSLSDADVAKLEQQGVYIQANQVQRVPH